MTLATTCRWTTSLKATLGLLNVLSSHYGLVVIQVLFFLQLVHGSPIQANVQGGGVAAAIPIVAIQQSSSTMMPTANPTPAFQMPPSAAGKPPAQVLNLKSFMLNLPVNSAGSPSGSMSWVKNPSLSSYSNPYFYVDSDTGGVVFISPIKGATSPESSYTRCELRELNPGSFSSSDGKTHSLKLDLSVDAIPRASSVCVAQIWGPSSSFFMIRAFDDGSFWVMITGASGMPQQLNRVPSGTINPRSRFSITVSLSFNVVKTVLSQSGAGSWSKTMSLSRTLNGLHLKTGAYCQTTGTNEVCKVTMYSLQTSHQ